jgi:hypothetical protein
MLDIVLKAIDAYDSACYHQFLLNAPATYSCMVMSDFGLWATDVREPRQVRKEATVTSLSVCLRSPEVWSTPVGF